MSRPVPSLSLSFKTKNKLITPISRKLCGKSLSDIEIDNNGEARAMRIATAINYRQDFHGSLVIFEATRAPARFRDNAAATLPRANSHAKGVLLPREKEAGGSWVKSDKRRRNTSLCWRATA